MIMYGLIMIREYLDEIVSGKKQYDARAYNTNKRGPIALVDTRRSEVVATIELVGVHKISAEEFCKWHATGKWEGTQFQVGDMSKTYYAYDFKRPRVFEKPIKIIKTGRMWTRIDDSLLEGVKYKSHAYETRKEIDGTIYIVKSVMPSTDDEKVVCKKVEQLILNKMKFGGK